MGPHRFDQRIRDLEHELNTTKESLQTTIEELETSNEELKSTNEELHREALLDYTNLLKRSNSPC
jgi:predicted ribosome quality control (RQC) complex YloA/Tae2 family protein